MNKIKEFMVKPYGEWTMVDGLKVMGVTYGLCGMVYLGYIGYIKLKDRKERKLIEVEEKENN